MARDNGRECKPGDRGDAKMKSGLGKLRSGYAGKLKSECSEGYEECPPAQWGGNVRR